MSKKVINRVRSIKVWSTILMWCALTAFTGFITHSLTACSDGSDCPINNVVYSTHGFYAIVDGEEQAVQILDTLTITAAGTDSVLINRMTGAQEVELPMSFTAATDTLIMHFTDTLQVKRIDTLWIDKTNTPHFESPTCPATMFHEVIAVRHTYSVIDSVVIVNPNINYNVSQNFKIYFRNN